MFVTSEIPPHVTVAIVVAVIVAFFSDVTVVFFIKFWLERQERIGGRLDYSPHRALNQSFPSVRMTTITSDEMAAQVPLSSSTPLNRAPSGLSNSSFRSNSGTLSLLSDPVVQVYLLVVIKCTSGSIMLKTLMMLATSPSKMVKNDWGLFGHWISTLQLCLLWLTASIVLNLLLKMTDSVVQRPTSAVLKRTVCVYAVPIMCMVAIVVERILKPKLLLWTDLGMEVVFDVFSAFVGIYVSRVLSKAEVVNQRTITTIRLACAWFTVAFFGRAVVIYFLASYLSEVLPDDVLAFDAWLSAANYSVLFGGILIFRANTLYSASGR